MRSIVIAALAWLAASPAAAQEITTTVTALTGRTVVDLTALSTVSRSPLTRAECTAGAQISFEFTNVDETRSQLHFYYGSMCDVSTVRNDLTDMSCTDFGLEYSIGMRTQVDQTIPVSSLIDCTSTSSGTRTIWVLALDEPTSDVALAGQQDSFPLAYDFAGPSAPSNFTARNGETSGTLEWDGSSDEITSYEIYLVENGCDATGAVTTTLLSDPDNPDASALVGTAEGSVTTSTVTLSGATGSQHAVAIRAIDQAGNTGPLSEVRCVEKIDVQTFWEAYCATHPDCESTGCSATPLGDGRGGFFALLPAIALLIWRRRGRG